MGRWTTYSSLEIGSARAPGGSTDMSRRRSKLYSRRSSTSAILVRALRDYPVMSRELPGEAPALASGRRARRSTVDEGVSYYRRHPQAAPLVVGARTWELLRWKEEIEPVPASYRTPLAAERRRRSGASPDCPQKLGLSDLEPRKVSCLPKKNIYFLWAAKRKSALGKALDWAFELGWCGTKTVGKRAQKSTKFTIEV